MKFTVNKSSIINALDLCAKVSGKNKALLVLNNVRMTIKDSELTIEASNADSSISRREELVFSEGDADFLIDCAALLSYARIAAGDQLQFAVENGQCTIRHASGKTSMPVLGTAAWPQSQISDGEPIGVFNVPSSFISLAMSNGAPFTGGDSFYPQMMALRLYFGDEYNGYSATDSRKLINEKVPAANTAQGESLIAQNIIPILAKCSAAGDVCRITIKDKCLVFDFGGTIICQTRLSAKYPDVERVIPNTVAHSVVCDKRELTDAVRRISTAATGMAPMRVDVAGNKIILKATDIDTQRTCEEIVGCESDADISVALSPSYMLTCLSAVDGQQVTLGISGQNKPVVFSGQGSDTRTVLLMTMGVA